MANWFKLYETDLDETRLKYALNKLPEVGWVWIGVLSECCKHRSDTIRWGKDEIDLFGFSDRLKVSIPKLNEAVNLLCEIEYIQKIDGHLKVLKWNEKQSDYCKRDARGDYQKKAKSQRISDNIGDSPPEERRGEEIRKEGEVKTLPHVLRISKEQELKRVEKSLAALRARKDGWNDTDRSDLKKLKEREARLIAELATT